MPHFSARRIRSQDDFEELSAARWCEQAGVQPLLHRRGRSARAARPYFDTMALIAHRRVRARRDQGDRHRRASRRPPQHDRERVLGRCSTAKSRRSRRAAWPPLVVTQFGFDPDAFLAWLQEAARARDRCPGADRHARPGRDQAPAALRRALRRRRFGQRDEEIWRLDHQPARQRRAGQAGRCLRRQAGRRARPGAAALLSVRRDGQDASNGSATTTGSTALG